MAYSPWIGNLTVRGVAGNYGTVKVLLDEASPAPSTTLTARVEIAARGLTAADFDVEVFTNLNRRDFAVAFEALSASNLADSYWLGHPLAHQGQAFDNLVFAAELPLTRCGAYRLTARYRLKGTTGWWWHNDFAPFDGAARHRDCAVVVSPAKAATARLYEANALTIEATQGGDYDNRSTLDDFLSTHDLDDFNPFHVGYISSTLGFNTLWLMPVFPQTRWCWDRQNWTWAANHSPGSPYATRDYWSINPWLEKDGRRDAAVQLFRQVVDEADAAGVDVFLDVAFNHAGRDVVYGEGAVQLGLCAPSEAEAWIREVRSGWCTRGVEFRDGWTIPYYRTAADNGFACAVWAPGDRLNEHVWDDANVDWFFGDYSALGPKPFAQAHDYWGNPVRHADDAAAQRMSGTCSTRRSRRQPTRHSCGVTSRTCCRSGWRKPAASLPAFAPTSRKVCPINCGSSSSTKRGSRAGTSSFSPKCSIPIRSSIASTKSSTCSRARITTSIARAT